MSSRLAEYVKARVPEARVERQWEAIERAGLPGPARGGSRRGLWWAASAGALCALVFGAARTFAPAPVPAGLQAGALVESAQGEVAVRLEELPGRQTVAIAGGRDKARAIAAVLESGVISGLITDEATAHELTVLAGGPVPSIGLRSATTTTGRAGHV